MRVNPSGVISLLMFLAVPLGIALPREFAADFLASAAAFRATRAIESEPIAAAGAGASFVDASADWPEGTELLDFENLEGVMLVTGRLQGSERDTSGVFVLDTGAGHLALDAPLAMRLGIVDHLPDLREDVGLAVRPLRRLEIGSRQLDQVSPVMTVDAEVVRRVTDRPVLGLLGQSLFRNQALWMDFREEKLALIPIPPTDDAIDLGRAENSRNGFGAGSSEPRTRRNDPTALDTKQWRRRALASKTALARALGLGAMAVPFELEGDGKIVVSASLSDPAPPRWSRPIELILDTGATKTVLFSSAIRRSIRGAARWKTLEGLSAPTLFGSESAAIALVPEIAIRVPGGSVRRANVDVAVLGGTLGALLSRATGRTVHGLLGYSFLRHFRVCIDYPHRVLWLERLEPEWDERPFEYSHPGLQIERVEDAVRVVAVARSSPAADAGILAGDELISVDGDAAQAIPIVELARRLEGEPGTRVDLVVRRGAHEQRYTIVRRQLL